MRRCIVYLSLTLLTGCAVGPSYQQPAAPNVNGYTEKPLSTQTASTAGNTGAAQSWDNGADIPAQWWQLFNSQALNDLINRGLANSPNLTAAQAALRQAQENLNAEIGTGLFPSISAQLSAQRSQSSSASSGQSGSAGIFNLYNASVNVSYNLDIFGATRKQIASLQAQVDYQRFQWEAAYLTLTSNIVTTAINEASVRAQIAATNELIAAQQQQLNIVQKQVGLGGASQMDVLSQQTTLAQTQATLPPLQKTASQLRNTLAVLVGAFPSQANLPDLQLEQLRLPTRLPVSLPSSLVQQRPDVRASEALLRQANAQVGVATANLMPQLQLTGSLGSAANSTSGLFGPGSGVWNIGAQLLQPIFQAGALQAKRRAASAAYDQITANYQQVVLQAFQNVADTLNALQTDADALRAQTQAENAARASLNLTQRQYKLGGVSYINVLDAQRQYQQTRINRIQAQAARYADTAALFQSLGGGWWNRK